MLLKKEGFTPDVVTSPRGVVDAIRIHTYDILLLDLNYNGATTSGGEGLELLAQIQAIDNCLPVVVMSAWGSIELVVESMQGGGRDFVQKPWDNDKLLGTLRRHVDDGRTLRERRRHEKANESLMQEITEARDIQRRLLPVEMPSIAGCDIQATWQPAQDVGGDYYDAIKLRGKRVALCIADVSGKGLPAALLMSNTQAAVRAFAHNSDSAAEMCTRLNRSVAENVTFGKFITLFYAVLDIERQKLRYTNAGHIPPVLIRRDGSILRPDCGGLVLGIFHDSEYQEAEISFNEGDRLVLFTDGIIEAADKSNDEFGVDRLIALLMMNRNDPAAKLQAEIFRSVSEFTDRGFQDDATLMIVSME